MDMSTLANPFKTWALLARGLRDRFVAELGEQPISPDAAEIDDGLEDIVRCCEHLGWALVRLCDKDRATFMAFLRALEKS